MSVGKASSGGIVCDRSESFEKSLALNELLLSLLRVLRRKVNSFQVDSCWIQIDCVDGE